MASLLRSFTSYLTRLPSVPRVTVSSLAQRSFMTAPLSKGQFLKPHPLLYNQSCGFKVKHVLKKRCKDCYIVCRDERWYVICPTNPRHKQMSMKKKDKYLWIISGASQSPVRPW